MRRDFMQSGGKQLEYIETTGTQWIETGLPMIMDSTHDIELDFELELTGYNGDDYLMGGNGTNNASRISPACWFTGSGSGAVARQFCINAYTADPYNIYTKYDCGLNVRHTYKSIFRLDRRECYIDNVLRGSSTYQLPTYNSGYTFALFGRRWRSNTVSAFVRRKLYWLDLRQGNVTLNLIPYLSQDEPGLLDINSNTFYTNQGTGSFLYN